MPATNGQPGGRRRPVARKATRVKPVAKATKLPAAKAPAPKSPAAKGAGLSEWLSPKNIQQSIKSVSHLRGMVKNWLNYLQQADQMLETFHVTATSLRETGVLDKLIKQRGKNLTTEDFTGILAALMSSPLGSQLFKGNGSQEERTIPAPQNESPATAAVPPPANPSAPPTGSPLEPPGQVGM